MAKIRKQTYTMHMYMNKLMDKDIRDDADVQRASGQWSNEQMNELIVTILTDGYMPPVFLGEESSSQMWIVDGLQRSTSLMMFRYGSYKITPAVEDSLLTYKAKVKDSQGNIVEDEHGDIVWEEVQFDIRNKTYEELPDELKKQFNEFQVETVIFEECDMKQISKLIKIYNNHTAMNTTQKAFTHIDRYAREVRGILDTDFFARKEIYSEADKKRGSLERIILESVMCMYHLDSWKKSMKAMAIYLNKNTSKDEFSKLLSNVHRLETIVTDDVKDIFTIRDSVIWLSLFDRFANVGLEDIRFAAVLRAFKVGLKFKEVNCILFDDVDKGKGTKDKAVIISKLNILEVLMYDFLQIDRDISLDANQDVDMLAFIRENVKANASEEDLDFYEAILGDLTLYVDNSTRLLEAKNRPSLLAIIGWACEKDIDLDAWIVEFFHHNTMYKKDQKKNLLLMIASLQNWIQKSVSAASI